MEPSTAILATLSVTLAFAVCSLAGNGVHAPRGLIALPTYPWAAIKHPYFRGHEVIDKTTGQPMFYVNHLIKPALIE